MKLCKVSDIVGGEKLARSIMTSNYQELLAAGTIIKPEYVPKFIQLGINEIFIEDGKLNPVQVQLLKDDVEDLLKEKVRSILERHIYSDSSDLKALSSTAENVMNNILSNEEVVEKIYDLKERSADIYEHSISVCALSVLISTKLKMEISVIHDLAMASIFHDIGLRYLDFDYTNQKLTDLEESKLTEYRKHPAYAFSSLEKENWITLRAKRMILQHHERSDGSGYPLHAKNCPIENQILQVSDAFDEMICGIGCTRMRVFEAVEYLKNSKNVLFSEEVVNTLLEFTAVYPAGTVVMLDTGEMAIVMKQNNQFPDKPVVRIIKDRFGQTIENIKLCDLTSNTVYVKKVLL